MIRKLSLGLVSSKERSLFGLSFYWAASGEKRTLLILSDIGTHAEPCRPDPSGKPFVPICAFLLTFFSAFSTRIFVHFVR